MIPSHASLPFDHVEALLWDDASDAEDRRMQSRLDRIRAEDDAEMKRLLESGALDDG